MIVNNLHVECVTVSPNETDAVLIVDADTVLALPIAFQSFETIAWKDCQIPQQMGRV